MSLRNSRHQFFASALLATVALTLPAHAEEPRIVSVGGSTTEIVYALGAGDTLVGVDSTSLYPAVATDLPDIGYVRQLSAEGLLSLNPDLILAGAEAGPPAALQQSASAGVEIVKLEEGFTPEDVYAHVATVGAALGREDEVAELVETLKADIGHALGEVAAVSSKPRVLFMLQAGRGPMLVSGRHTAADAMIELAGGVNAVTEFDGYKPFSPEAATVAAPDIILMTDQTVEALGGAEKILADASLAPTPAARNGRLVTMDALYLAGFGPRLGHAILDLASKLHPEHDFTPLPERPWTKAQ
ncbi:heme/hemin ABC transporter substrate-binding protein [Parvibaculum sp.]|jgi:iron complex transport system substrate-binding protein|uniref:heme/hemin ABC transporter substrate-binding protein n=1 Tax=Parvibaculum sp. TaxID=2024848 RepID=UPI002FDB460A